MNRSSSFGERARNAWKGAGFSTKASLRQNMKVASALKDTGIKAAKNRINTEKESYKARQRAKQSGMELPDHETFQTRKCLTDLLDPNGRAGINQLTIGHLIHKAKDERHRDFILQKVFAKFHLTNASTERDIASAGKGLTVLEHLLCKADHKIVNSLNQNSWNIERLTIFNCGQNTSTEALSAKIRTQASRLCSVLKDRDRVAEVRYRKSMSAAPATWTAKAKGASLPVMALPPPPHCRNSALSSTVLHRPASSKASVDQPVKATYSDLLDLGSYQSDSVPTLEPNAIAPTPAPAPAPAHLPATKDMMNFGDLLKFDAETAGNCPSTELVVGQSLINFNQPATTTQQPVIANQMQVPAMNAPLGDITSASSNGSNTRNMDIMAMFKPSASDSIPGLAGRVQA